MLKKKSQILDPALNPKELLFFLNQAAPAIRTPLTVEAASDLIKNHFGFLEDPGLVPLALERSANFALTRQKSYVTKEVLFNGACLRIQPSKNEIRQGILIPGHRFIPLWWSKNTQQLSVKDSSGEKISYAEREISFEEAFSYNYLLGYSWFTDHPPVDKSSYPSERGIFQVLDLENFYRKNCFKPQDFIIVKIKDPWEKEIVLHYESRLDVLNKVGKVRATDVALEKTFLKIIEKPHILWSIPIQLFHVFAAAPVFTRHIPGSPFDQFFKRTSLLSLQEVGLEMAAFPPDTTPFQMALKRCRNDRVKEDVFSNSIDQLFTNLGINFQSDSIQGLIRLTIYKGHPFSKLISSIIPWKRITIEQIDDARTLKVELRKLWDKLLEVEKEKPLNPELAELLSRAAKLKQRIFTILQQLDLLRIEAEDLPSRPLLQLMEVDELSDFILQFKDYIVDDVNRFVEIADLLFDLESHMDKLQEDVLREVLV